MFGGFGATEILMVLVVVLLLFGAKRIPEIAGSFGKGIKEFKKNMNEAKAEFAAPVERESLPPAQPRTVQHDDAPEKEPRRLL